MKNNKQGRMNIDKAEYMRENTHLARPPRLKAVVQKARSKANKKKK